MQRLSSYRYIIARYYERIEILMALNITDGLDEGIYDLISTKKGVTLLKQVQDINPLQTSSK